MCTIEVGQRHGLARRDDLFSVADDGDVAPIHLNDIKADLIALYHRSPVDLPHQVTRANGGHDHTEA